MDNKKPDYIEEFKEWQENQFSPGHFVGGKIPVWMKHPGKPKLLGSIFLFTGLISLSPLVYSIFTDPNFNTLDNWFGSVFLILYGILAILFGVKLLSK